MITTGRIDQEVPMKTEAVELHEEHAHLLAHVERLRDVADAVGEVDLPSLHAAVDGVYAFLSHQLLPHAEVEDRVLYPAVARVLGGPRATATMSRDHVEVGRLIRDLAVVRTQIDGGVFEPRVAAELRRILYGLYELLKVHIAKEEEIYLRILEDELSTDELQRVLEGVEVFEAAEQAAE
jgi:hemerythrin-like domain-containing protein